MFRLVSRSTAFRISRLYLGSEFTMVGYGTSGDGIAGYNVSPSFRVKRKGANIFDVYETDDEQDYAPNSPWEVWYYDFDGTVQGLQPRYMV